MEKKYKILRWLLYIFLAIVFLVAITMALSPYGSNKKFPYRVVTQSIEINATPEKVFAFLGNSSNAARWSSFVHHITVLNIDSFADGNAGSRRRCFRNKNENGMQWDELITNVSLNKERELSIYNLQHFAMTAENLATKQLYKNAGDKGCRLTFTLFFKNDKPAMLASMKLYIAAYKISSIFKKNLLNIKKIIELDQND